MSGLRHMKRDTRTLFWWGFLMKLCMQTGAVLQFEYHKGSNTNSKQFPHARITARTAQPHTDELCSGFCFCFFTYSSGSFGVSWGQYCPSLADLTVTGLENLKMSILSILYYYRVLFKSYLVLKLIYQQHLSHCNGYWDIEHKHQDMNFGPHCAALALPNED